MWPRYPLGVKCTHEEPIRDTTGSNSAAAGDNIEVKLTTTGFSGNFKQWRVRFRY